MQSQRHVKDIDTKAAGIHGCVGQESVLQNFGDGTGLVGATCGGLTEVRICCGRFNSG